MKGILICSHSYSMCVLSLEGFGTSLDAEMRISGKLFTHYIGQENRMFPVRCLCKSNHKWYSFQNKTKDTLHVVTWND